jgi:hypothetical protein
MALTRCFSFEIRSHTASLPTLLPTMWDSLPLRGFLQRVAEAHGSASAKKAKSVLHGVIGYAVDNGVLSSDATRQVRTVTSTTAKSGERDHTRAMTRSERDYVIHVTLLAAREPGLNPRTRRKRARPPISSRSWQERGPGSMKLGAFGGRMSTLSTDASICAAQRAKRPIGG